MVAPNWDNCFRPPQTPFRSMLATLKEDIHASIPVCFHRRRPDWGFGRTADVLSGRIGGISGIVGGLLPPKLADDWRLRLAFIAGLLLAPLILNAVVGFNGIGAPTVGFAILLPAGFLIGAGSALENGCTSGHGICGLARLSPRSVVATMTFMTVAVVTVFVMRHVI